METLPITLIVKAPNQQIEDQQIKCELSWTINKLKQHLSEVYPSKPPKHEQKLIYSGQLLSDSVTLKDVLRQYEGQETHTVHLVCTTQQNRSPQKINQTPTITTTRPVITEQLPQTPPNTPTSTTIQDNIQTTTGQTIPNLWTNHPYDPNQFPRDPNQYAMQLAMMQQAYLQYMTQYMQLAANSYGVTQNQHLQNENIQQPQPEPAAVIRDPDDPEHDWLDIFYMLSRVMILFSVVYFYSSPIRFVFVLLLGFALYLYQTGFFRNINNNNNNNNINNNNNNNNNRIPGNNEPTVAGQEQQQSERQQEQQQEEQAPSRLMVIWTFFTTFFASLIPEIPNAI